MKCKIILGTYLNSYVYSEREERGEKLKDREMNFVRSLEFWVLKISLVALVTVQDVRRIPLYTHSLSDDDDMLQITKERQWTRTTFNIESSLNTYKKKCWSRVSLSLKCDSLTWFLLIKNVALLLSLERALRVEWKTTQKPC